jgi:membrane carboxypeptidase/penicillin-binding protein
MRKARDRVHLPAPGARENSQFNRAVQACRQPDSTYKPVYYSLALDRGYGSLLNDIPRAEVDPITGEVWVPQNLNNTVEYQVNLEYALVWSKNVSSVQLFKLVGAKDVEAWARRHRRPRRKRGRYRRRRLGRWRISGNRRRRRKCDWSNC